MNDDAIPHSTARSRRADESLDMYIQRLWPEAPEAIANVDRTLFQTTLPLSPVERLEQVTQAAWELEALQSRIRRDR